MIHSTNAGALPDAQPLPAIDQHSTSNEQNIFKIIDESSNGFSVRANASKSLKDWQYLASMKGTHDAT